MDNLNHSSPEREPSEPDETKADENAMSEQIEMPEIAAEPSERAGKQPVDIAAELYDWLEIMVVAITVVLLIFHFVGRMVTVNGTSMLPTLTHGEKLIIQELFYEPEQGDIVICQSASYGMEEPLVKRVIALGGQTITIDFETWQVFVDGVALEEDYVNFQQGVTMNGWDYGESYVVPQGYVFVMGDNRNGSTDSRRMLVGPIDERLIIGKAIVGFSSESGMRFFQ